MQKRRKSISKTKLREFFDYCPSGNLIRTKKTSGRTKLGERVGVESHGGYRVFVFQNEKLYLHRAIFVWHHGRNPHSVDHIDRNPRNNKIENLRGVSHQENLCNLGLAKHNTSGVRGLYFDKRDRAFYGQIVFKGKTLNVGRSKNRKDVIASLQNFREKIYANVFKGQQ